MWLSREQAQAIIAHARADLPYETCGLIVGHGDRAVEVIPIPNAAVEPLHSYVMDPRTLLKALLDIEARGLELVGFYHSHPEGDPIPSRTDVRQATYPATPYLIVGLKGGEARLAAWIMHTGQVDSVPVHVGMDAPPQVLTLSKAQKIAILLTALIAAVLMIVVSLTLLPPAPVIPR